MLSFLLILAALILLPILFVILGLGFALALGCLLLVGVGVAFFGLFFGDGSTLAILTGAKQGSDIPQRFNTCLMQSPSENCRLEFTTWDTAEIELVRGLALEVQRELGARIDSTTTSQSYSQVTEQGETVLTIDVTTDFARHKAVREHYVLISHQGVMKIKELKWDY